MQSTKAAKRRRCGDCDGCTATDCEKCHYCLDKTKFGGRGVLKRCCQLRKCKKLKLISEGINLAIANTYNYISDFN